jgi:Na+/H+ antiporter NhaD/arsenite permease-like protein
MTCYEDRKTAEGSAIISCMPMNAETKELLARWQALDKGSGLRRVDLMALVLGVLGLVLSIFVALSVVYRLPPALIAFAAAVMGWSIAERNALRTRRAQWPVFRNYIDWQLVREDLGKEDEAVSPSGK